MKEVRNLTKLGDHSYYVVIPAYMVRGLGWKERQKMVVGLKGKRIEIYKSSRRK